MIEVTLRAKNLPVPLIYQPVYKLVILLAILKYGTRNPHRSPFIKLHLYFWGLRSQENYYNLVDLKKTKRMKPWSFEPALNETVSLAVINKYCVRKVVSNKLQIELTTKGKEVFQKIENTDYFQDDISKIKNIGNISLSVIEQANSNWSLNF